MSYKLLKNYKGSSFLSPAHGRVGARATSSLFQYAPPPPEKTLWGFQQAGKKEGGLGEGIFARLPRAEGANGWEAFPPSWYQDIKAKQFSNPFRTKRVAQKIQKLKRKLFCFARRNSAGGNAGAGFLPVRAEIVAQKRFELRPVIATRRNLTDFASNQSPLNFKKV